MSERKIGEIPNPKESFEVHFHSDKNSTAFEKMTLALSKKAILTHAEATGFQSEETMDKPNEWSGVLTFSYPIK